MTVIKKDLASAWCFSQPHVVLCGQEQISAEMSKMKIKLLILNIACDEWASGYRRNIIYWLLKDKHDKRKIYTIACMGSVSDFQGLLSYNGILCMSSSQASSGKPLALKIHEIGLYMYVCMCVSVCLCVYINIVKTFWLIVLFPLISSSPLSSWR